MQSIQELPSAVSTSLATPRQLKQELPLSERAAFTVARGRAEAEAILQGHDDRLLVVVGPCSIHDPDAALVYARRLLSLRARHEDELLLCMRVYFEKPRTTVGWKGLINDPHLDGSFDIAHGLRVSRRLLLSLAELGMPTAGEALDTVTPQYLADLSVWSAIGARTTESQPHRELASGLAMPVGFKNGTDGGLEVAVHAMLAAQAPHRFLGIDADGQVSVVRTPGNLHTHVVLRGGSRGPNFDEASVRSASHMLRSAGLQPRVMVDCSHGNSQKNHDNQPRVAQDVAAQVARADSPIFGVMLESALVAGRQDLKPGSPLVYGQSITDACIDIEATEQVLAQLSEAVREKRARQ